MGAGSILTPITPNGTIHTPRHFGFHCYCASRGNEHTGWPRFPRMSTELLINSRDVYHPRAWLTSWPATPVFYLDKAECARVEGIPLSAVVSTRYIGGEESIYIRTPPTPPEPEVVSKEPQVTCRGVKRKRK